MRCSYCHESLSLPAPATCAGCGTVLHSECRDDLGRCPTLGCTSPSLAQTRAPTFPPRVVDPWRQTALQLFGTVGPILAFVVDAVVRINPLIWSWDSLTWGWGAFERRDFSPRLLVAVSLAQLPVYAALALSLIGMRR